MSQRNIKYPKEGAVSQIRDLVNKLSKKVPDKKLRDALKKRRDKTQDENRDKKIASPSIRPDVDVEI
ncbi:MAG: hypothetical protein HUU45_15615 [Leptospiraceae bacterium]|nr:hypothetical protein [Leptospiraceae bacterium]